MRGKPIEVRRATLAGLLRKSRPGVCLNEHLKHPEGPAVFAHTCKLGLEGGLCPSGSDRATDQAERTG
jgi:hypothetical protein